MIDDRACGGARFRGIHVIADDDPRWQRDPVEQARAACAGGAAVVQLRTKHATDREALRLARAIREATRATETCFVMNDRFDLALAAEADAVHLGQDDLPPEALPAEARERLSIGRSTHTRAQAQDAAREPIAYAALGPIYGTTSKSSEYARRSLALVSEVAEIVAPMPLVAIGGITLPQVPELVAAGARGIAVISAVAGSDDPEQAVRALCGAFRDAITAAEPQPREAR